MIILMNINDFSKNRLSALRDGSPAGYNFLRGAFGGGGGMSTEREANLMVAKTFGILDINLLAVCNFNRDAVD